MKQDSSEVAAALAKHNAEQLQILLSDVGDPDVARLVVDHFDAHPEMRSRYAALYLAARRALITNPVEAAGVAVGRAIRGLFDGLKSPPKAPAKAPRAESSAALTWPTLFGMDEGRAYVANLD